MSYEGEIGKDVYYDAPSGLQKKCSELCAKMVKACGRFCPLYSLSQAGTTTPAPTSLTFHALTSMTSRPASVEESHLSLFLVIAGIAAVIVIIIAIVWCSIRYNWLETLKRLIGCAKQQPDKYSVQESKESDPFVQTNEENNSQPPTNPQANISGHLPGIRTSGDGGETSVIQPVPQLEDVTAVNIDLPDESEPPAEDNTPVVFDTTAACSSQLSMFPVGHTKPIVDNTHTTAPAARSASIPSIESIASPSRAMQLDVSTNVRTSCGNDLESLINNNERTLEIDRNEQRGPSLTSSTAEQSSVPRLSHSGNIGDTATTANTGVTMYRENAYGISHGPSNAFRLKLLHEGTVGQSKHNNQAHMNCQPEDGPAPVFFRPVMIETMLTNGKANKSSQNEISANANTLYTACASSDNTRGEDVMCDVNEGYPSEGDEASNVNERPKADSVADMRGTDLSLAAIGEREKPVMEPRNEVEDAQYTEEQ